ncbi:COQ9 family protein [Croceibacterium sp. LX-88]|jgi:ubiquinone biosynthesis protein COQ9|uniref:COQ9 family protein n=1 Tax=Croceibacterium selenioxidans TaxID=2838833 RepID=A0ABS5W5N8_9SPHN|nr:COQ9 family protein [Croceibacterium selenioxidans]MBT2135065.1 COQ9 family protein [Croceibacterium selenioxidans]
MAQDDRTLDELRLDLAPEIARVAVFDGWGDQALEQAAAKAGVDLAVARLAFPGGAMDMIAAWIASTDARMQAAFSGGQLTGFKIRDRIRTLLQFRLDAVAGQEEALRRALAIQAMPQNLGRTMKLGWNSADQMWRLAGDTATDYNHYTKRALLAGIYTATLAVFLDDTSEGKAETRAFLDRRIEGVMKFEKAKARVFRDREGFDVARFLGRLRYPAR